MSGDFATMKPIQVKQWIAETLRAIYFKFIIIIFLD